MTWRPQPGPQTVLVESAVPDTLYGGARGGGKSHGLLGDALLRALEYGKAFRGLLLRRTLVEFTELARIAQEIYTAVGGVWSEKNRTWTLPREGTVRLNYLDTDADAEQYQGHQYTWLGVDEAGNFPRPEPIDKLWGSLRSPEGVPCVRRMSANPGGPGHAWIKSRYIDGGPFRVQAIRPARGEEPELPARWYIPAKLEDNPILMQGDPGYADRLRAAGSKKLYDAWRKGDWSVPLGAYYDLWDPELHTYDPGEPPWRDAYHRERTLPEWFPRWLACDWGFVHASAAYWLARSVDGVTYVYRELVRPGRTPRELGEDLRAESRGERVGALYLSPDAFGRKASERTYADEFHDAEGALPYPTAADNDRVGGALLVYQLLARRQLLISRSCTRLIEVLPTLTHDPKHPEDVLKVDGDDPYDALRYGLKSRERHAEVPAEHRIALAVRELDPTSAMIRRREMELREARAVGPVAFAGRRRRAR